MCGIIGVLNLAERPPVEEETLRGMLHMLRHRGPDEFGLYRDAQVGLGNARLSILDLTGGQQPIGNEEGTLWIVYNGEAFNHPDLRPSLEARGHRLTTHTDTEVILHLYEDYGPACLDHLNGQFAIAIWDARDHSLFLARDRLGVRPLYYTVHDGRLIFASEIKAILACPGVPAEIDLASLDQIFTFWSTLSPRTAFRGIFDLPPGHYMLVREGQLALRRYWSLGFAADPPSTRAAADYQEELESLLIDATRIRLRADVPVGAYLSGGLDSSITTAIARGHNGNRLETFSIAFDDSEFDESRFQRQMASFLDTEHRVVHCTHADIGRVFPEVLWYTEMPVLRTAPAPMYLLSGLVHDHGFKVVLTGEGADEILGGYDIYKEMKIRRFWAKRPESQIRPLLLRRLYPDIADLGSVGGSYLQAFFKRELQETDSPYYSHAIRWANTARTKRLFLRQQTELPVGKHGYQEPQPLPDAFAQWTHLGQAQYLEMSIFLPQYLLSAQGDRMGMAHSVEGRFPFLDYRVVEFCSHLPPGLKLHGLTEKWLLKQLGRKLLPTNIWQRPKRPYRAPIHHSFFGQSTPDYVHDVLSTEALQESELFIPAAVAQLASKASQNARLSEVDEMALVGVISTQLLYNAFVKCFRRDSHPALGPTKLVDRLTANS